MKKYFLLISLAFSGTVFAQSGCCSYHQGVDYCGSDGHVYCRDGQQSPSCTCGNQNNIAAPDSTKNAFDIFSFRDMGSPNPLLEPLAVEWIKKNS